jgi:hypothetical protein
MFAENTNATPDAGAGLHAKSAATGVWGESSTWMGVYGSSQSAGGVMGESQTNAGMLARSHAEFVAGIEAENVNTTSNAGPGVRGKSPGTGVWGESTTWMGVYGKTDSTTGGAGVMGEGVAGGPGVIGKSQHWHGVYGETSAAGETGAAAVWGENKANGSGVVGHSVNGAGVYARSDTGAAAVFDGRVEVHGDIEVTGDIKLTGADVAEQFDVTTDVPAGSVVCLDDSVRVDVCRRPYDKRVAGIVSGLGDRQPAVVLDRTDRGPRRPVAVVGKAWCLADAQDAPIEVGDLLTTSGRPGYAMAAREPSAAFGAVIGKALTPLATGCGMVLALVSLG